MNFSSSSDEKTNMTSQNCQIDLKVLKTRRKKSTITVMLATQTRNQYNDE